MDPAAALAFAAVSVVATRAPVGDLLRDWRQRRRLSQLDLSNEAGVSARHLSFLKTGRAQPSREMVLHLAEQLEIPLRDRNDLLLAAGYAPIYGRRQLDHPDMAAVRAAVVRDQRPAVVDRDRRIRIVAVEDELHRFAHRDHLGLVEGALLVDGGMARGQQEAVALAQRDVELVGQVQHHLGAGPGAAGLDEAEVPRRHARLEREIELAQVPAPAPVAQQRPDRPYL